MSTGAGYTVAVRDQYGKPRPIIFLRQDVNASPANVEEEQNHPDFEAVVKLLVLMHELGHADDIAKSVNYNHENKSLDLVSAEAYAHAFVCRHARRIGYRLALGTYLDNIEQGLAADDPSVKLPAQRAVETLDLPSLREFAKINGNVEQRVRRSGRLTEVLEHFKAQPGG